MAEAGACMSLPADQHVCAVQVLLQWLATLLQPVIVEAQRHHATVRVTPAERACPSPSRDRRCKAPRHQHLEACPAFETLQADAGKHAKHALVNLLVASRMTRPCLRALRAKSEL